MSKIILCMGFLGFFTTAASALATDANSCASQSAKLKASERNTFMKNCMAQLSSPASIKEKEQQNKKALCEQNAKNRKLQGNEKANYLTTCMNENQAQAVASKAPAKPQAKAKPEKSRAPVKTAQKKDTSPSPVAKSCAHQATDKGLNGDARSKFMDKCIKG